MGKNLALRRQVVYCPLAQSGFLSRQSVNWCISYGCNVSPMRAFATYFSQNSNKAFSLFGKIMQILPSCSSCSIGMCCSTWPQSTRRGSPTGEDTFSMPTRTTKSPSCPWWPWTWWRFGCAGWNRECIFTCETQGLYTGPIESDWDHLRAFSIMQETQALGVCIFWIFLYWRIINSCLL